MRDSQTPAGPSLRPILLLISLGFAALCVASGASAFAAARPGVLPALLALAGWVLGIACVAGALALFWIRRGRAGLREKDLADLRNRRGLIVLLAGFGGWMVTLVAIAVAVFVWARVGGLRGAMLAGAIVMFAGALAMTLSYLTRWFSGIPRLRQRARLQLFTVGYSLVIGTILAVLAFEAPALHLTR